MNDHLHDFAAAAADFCQWCQSPPEAELVEVNTARRHLARLCLLAHSLREIDAPDIEGDRTSDAVWHAVHRRSGALPFQYYATVLDPLAIDGDQAACGLGDLGDDIADMHRDLSLGLALYQRGHLESAEWTWAFTFRTHWGRHAVDAWKALHVWYEAHADSGSSRPDS